MGRLRNIVLSLGLAIGLSGCVVGTAVGVAGDVAEGAVRTTVGAAKVTGKAAGVLIPGDGDADDDSRD